MKKAVFSDIDYQLLSDNSSITLKQMKSFDKTDEKNLRLYNDKAYKIIQADKAFDCGLYEEKICKNGVKRKVKSKTVIPQKIIITFSRKMMEYQRYIRNRQIERAKKILKNLDPDTYKKGPHDVTRFIKRKSKTTSGEEVTELYEIDQSVIEEEEKYDGFYASTPKDSQKSMVNNFAIYAPMEGIVQLDRAEGKYKINGAILSDGANTGKAIQISLNLLENPEIRKEYKEN